MCDACLCPECRGLTSEKSIMPYQIKQSDGTIGQVKWMCKTCFGVRAKSNWLIPEESDLRSEQHRIWADDSMS